MTSLAQLKYLDAMEIPVWVSRDLVSQARSTAIADVESPIDAKSSQIAFDKQHVPINTVSKTSSDNAAQSIIDSLESSHTNKPNSSSRDNISQLVNQTLDKTQLPQADLNISSKQSVTSKNPIHQTEQHYVFASGNESPDWMVIGHSPESYNGIGQEPFAGEAGELLDNMIRAVGIEHPRTQARYINVIDKQSIVDDTSNIMLNTYLIDHIEQLKPKIVLIVGQIAAQNLLNAKDPLVIMRSKLHTISKLNTPCVVTYYPSYLVQKPLDKRKAWIDLKLAMSTLIDVG